jgi:NitT/TauT family transport system substrate-binding protein
MATRLWVPALLSLALLVMVAPSADSAAIGLAGRRASAVEAGPASGAASGRAAEAAPLAGPGPQTATVRVGVLNIAADAPFYFAKERGYLQEQGLDAEYVRFDSGQQMIAPLGVDQLDAGGGAVGPGLANAIARGVNVRIVADWARDAPGTRFNCMMVRRDLLDSGTVRTVADLRGRVYSENVPGSILTYVFERDLQQAGLRPDELRYQTVPFSDMLSAFGNGLVDVAYGVEPFQTLGEERGLTRCWRYASETAPDLQNAAVLYGPSFAEQRTEAARGFLVAYLRAVRDYHRAFFGDGQGRAEQLELLARTTPIRDQALLARLAPTWMDPNGGVNVASLQAVHRWYVDRGDLTPEADFARAVDPTFAEYAVARLGRYP